MKTKKPITLVQKILDEILKNHTAGKVFTINDFRGFSSSSPKPNSSIASCFSNLAKRGIIERAGDSGPNPNGGRPLSTFRFCKPTASECEFKIKTIPEQIHYLNDRTLELQEALGIRIIVHQVPSELVRQFNLRG